MRVIEEMFETYLSNQNIIRVAHNLVFSERLTSLGGRLKNKLSFNSNLIHAGDIILLGFSAIYNSLENYKTENPLSIFN